MRISAISSLRPLAVCSVLLVPALCACRGGEASRPADPGIEAPGIPTEAQASSLPGEVRELTSDWTCSTTAGRRWTVAWRSRPAAIPLNAPFELDVLVFGGPDDPDQSRRGDLTVRVDAGMPQHHHGMNRSPRVTLREDGAHVVDGMLFHMPGAWELYVDVFEGTVSERARFAIELDG